MGIRGIEINFVPSNFLMSVVQATTGANGFYTAQVPPSTYSVEIDQTSTPSGSEKFVYSEMAVFLPSASGATYSIEPAKKVQMYGNLLGAATNLRLRLSGPEERNLTLSSMSYSTYVLPGTYSVYATGKIGSSSYANTSLVDVSLTSRNFDFYLQKANALWGVIGIGSTAVSRPVTIQATASGGEVITAKSATNGSYSLDLPPGTYSVEFVLEDLVQEGSSYVYIQYSSTQQVTMGSTDLGLSPSLVFELDNTTFRGTVVGKDGSPAQAQVELIANGLYGQSVLFSTDALGAFDERVQPGDYTIHVTRLQDKRSHLSTLTLVRNTPKELTIELADARYLSGTVTADDQPLSVSVQVSSGSAKVDLMAADDGSFSVLVPGGQNYTLAALTTLVEHDLNVTYSGSSKVLVGSTDSFVDFKLNRDTRRTVAVYWNRTLTQAAAPGVKVTYAVSVVNTGNIEDTYLATFTGSGFTVSFSPSEFTLDFGSNNNVTMLVDVTAGSTLPAADTSVACLVRSKTSTSSRVSFNLYVNVSAVHGLKVTSLNGSVPVSSIKSVTSFRVNNTGNVADVVSVSIANSDALLSLGWTAEILDPSTGAAVTSVNISAFGSKQLNVSFTSVRADADPSAEAYILASSALFPGVSSYGSIPVMLPDMFVAPGNLQVSRNDVMYQIDLTNLYVNTGLVTALAVLVVAFFYLRRKKGLGGGAKK